MITYNIKIHHRVVHFLVESKLSIILAGTSQLITSKGHLNDENSPKGIYVIRVIQKNCRNLQVADTMSESILLSCNSIQYGMI